MWAVASAVESVIVTNHAVATKPSRHKTKILPCQKDSRRSSITTEPWPCGLSAATRRYIGTMPRSVSNTMSRVATGESAPAAAAAMAGR